MSKKRRNHSPEFKSKVALAAIKGDQTLLEMISRALEKIKFPWSLKANSNKPIFVEKRGKRLSMVVDIMENGHILCLIFSPFVEQKRSRGINKEDTALDRRTLLIVARGLRYGANIS